MVQVEAPPGTRQLRQIEGAPAKRPPKQPRGRGPAPEPAESEEEEDAEPPEPVRCAEMSVISVCGTRV